MKRKPHQTAQANNGRPGPIRPEAVAAKLAAIRNYEHPESLEQITQRPRLIELMWHLQYESCQPGGLWKFTEHFLSEFPERLGTPSLVKAGDRNLTVDQKAAVFAEIPERRAPHVNVSAWDEMMDHCSDRSREEVDAAYKKAVRAALAPHDAASFKEICRTAAMEVLPKYLARLCANASTGFVGAEETITVIDNPDSRYSRPYERTLESVWFFHDVIGALLEFIDRRAARVRQRLAMTEVASVIFDALDYALDEKIMVRIEGSSRFGKTESFETWTAMRPGLARLVRVPSTNSMSDFLKRVAEALGMDCSYGSRTDRLRERIEYVLKHGGLFLVFDEGAWCIPQNYSATTPPSRLNWMRDVIVDSGLPMAIAVTPQSFNPAVNRYVKKTGYTMEQFIGRNFLVKRLPNALSEADLIAVARIHFPELDEDSHGFIASEARLANNYLQAVEAISRRARWLAKRHARPRVTFADVEAAAAEVLPRAEVSAAVPTVQASDSERSAGETRSDSGRFNRPLTAAETGVKRARKTSPVPAAAENLDSRSLRGAGPERLEAELISADD
jgi:hypothetical protein